NRSYAWAYYLRGELHEEIGNARQSAADYAEAVRLDPASSKKLLDVYVVRYLRVVNRTKETIRVYLRYEMRTKSGKWRWYPEGPEGEPKRLYVDLAPDRMVYVLDGDWQVRGRKIRIWAESKTSKKVWVGYRDQDLRIAPADCY